MKRVAKKIMKILGVKDVVDNKIHQYKVDKAIRNRNIEERFSKIYEDGVWFGNKESASGSGSTLEITKNVRDWLPGMLDQLETTTLVDVGCGDFNWMKEIKLNCNYIGTDIVKSVIDNNNKLYKNDKTNFLYGNAINESIPDGDVIICRDVLFHLSFEDGLKLINNIKKSSAKYLITTSHKEMDKNEDIYSGNFRKISLELPPYSFIKPIELLFETEKLHDRFLGVWDLADLRN